MKKETKLLNGSFFCNTTDVVKKVKATSRLDDYDTSCPYRESVS